MIIDTGAPSSDHYCIDVVVPSSDHCYTERAPTERVPPSSDHCYTETVPPYSDHSSDCTKKMAAPSSSSSSSQYCAGQL